jgi:anti-sigma factor RsiW
MTHDELISAYVDEQLSESERAVFENLLREDAALQRSMNATRFVIHAAQQLPTATLPHSFMLPASMAQPERMRFNWRFVFRIGSGIAAALFVVLIGLDLSALLPRPTFQPTPVIAPSASSPHLSVIETVQLTGLPQAPRSPQLASSDSGAEVAVTAPQARATKSLNSLSKLTPTMIATAIPTTLKTAIELTPVPTLASVVPTDVNQTWATWPRLLAVFVLAFGAMLAFLGWRK